VASHRSPWGCRALPAQVPLEHNDGGHHNPSRNPAWVRAAAVAAEQSRVRSRTGKKGLRKAAGQDVTKRKERV